jgi:hypothetical protein
VRVANRLAAHDVRVRAKEEKPMGGENRGGDRALVLIEVASTVWQAAHLEIAASKGGFVRGLRMNERALV